MAIKPFWNRRRGVAMVLVLLLGIVILVLGTAMITTSGGFFETTVDAKQRIRSRYAAEAMVAVKMATLEKLKDSLIAGNLSLASVPATLISSTGNGEMAQASAVKQSVGGQQLITTGDCKGLMGSKVSFLVKPPAPHRAEPRPTSKPRSTCSRSLSPSSGCSTRETWRSTRDRDGHRGAVHTNGNAYFRAWSDRKKLRQQPLHPRSGPHRDRHHLPMDRRPSRRQDLLLPHPGLHPHSQPVPERADLRHHPDDQRHPARPGERGVQHRPRHSPIEIAHRWGRSPRTHQALHGERIPRAEETEIRLPDRRHGQVHPWPHPPTVQLDHRRQRVLRSAGGSVGSCLVRNVGALPKGDSIFYLYDSVLMAHDKGKRNDTVINAFKLYNAAHLSRNLSIASGNPIYVEGSFNAAYQGSPCKPVDYVGTVPESERYCNTMIACDAFTLLSPNWSYNNRAAKGDTGTLEQKFSTSPWLPGTQTEPLSGSTDSFAHITDTLNAAILTGNKPTDSMYLLPLATNNSNGYFEGKYEGGWHNTIRFLENWNGSTVRFRGSFVCLWPQNTRGLKQDRFGGLLHPLLRPARARLGIRSPLRRHQQHAPRNPVPLHRDLLQLAPVAVTLPEKVPNWEDLDLFCLG